MTRDMNATQRAMAAAALANLEHGQHGKSVQLNTLTLDQAAERFGVPKMSVRRARVVLASDSDARNARLIAPGREQPQHGRMAHPSRAGRPVGRTTLSRKLLALADGSQDERVRLEALRLCCELVGVAAVTQPASPVEAVTASADGGKAA